MLFTIARKSLFNRKFTALLTVISIAMSVFVLLGVEHIQYEAKRNFTRTLSDTDLVVGARSGEMNLLLYSVFRIGNATNNVTWHSYQKFAHDPQVAWTIPFSLGDSHRGYRVLGTNLDYFTHYKYADKRPLAFKKGKAFDGLYDVVLGAEVAQRLGYDLQTSLVLAHGIAETSFTIHDDAPFKVVGVLEATGTPVDKTLHISLQAMEAIHTTPDKRSKQLVPKNITAFLVGLNSKMTTFSFQRTINEYPNEAMMAILPMATLAGLWNVLASVETVLLIISLLVLFSALIGMCTMLMSSLKERNRELAILRALGANPVFSMVLIQLEVLLLTVSGIMLAVFALFISLIFGEDILINQYGVFISSNFLHAYSFKLLGIVIATALMVGMLPAWFIYRQSLQQGLTIKR